MNLSEALHEACQAQGVQGALLLDDEGACVAHSPPAGFDALPDIAGRVRAIFDVLSSLEPGEPVELTLAGDEGVLALRRVEGMWLLLRCDPEVNANLLAVAMHVAALAIERNSIASCVPTPCMPPARLAVNAVPLTVVKALLELYAEHIGPAARLIFKQQLHELGATAHSLDRCQVPELVSRLTARIPLPRARDAFARGARSYSERMLLL